MIRVSLLVLVALVSLSSPARGQTLTGRIVDGASLDPIEGALVIIFDTDSTRVATVLSGLDGRYSVRLPTDDRYRLRVQRIGYATLVTDEVDREEAARGPFDIAMSVEAVSLAPIVATGSGRCTVDPRTGEQTALLWDLASRVLEVTALINREELLDFRLLRFRRELDPDREVLKDERIDQTRVTRPFHSVPAEYLAANGYVQGIEDETTYHMPDPEVALSESFLANHCFHIAVQEGPRGRLVGLAFEPLGRDGPPDVAGVLWLDGETTELRYLEYDYTGLPEVVDGVAGGRAEFERLGTGAWVVRRWSMSMPRIGRRSRLLGLASEWVLLGIWDEGGEILAATDSEGALVTRRGSLQIEGQVWDLDRSAPLAGATVYLSGTGRLTEAGSDGRFHFDGLTPGEYLVTFSHPLLDTMVVYPPTRTVRLPGRQEEILLNSPSRGPLLEDLCPDFPAAAPVGVLSGQVRDPDDRPMVDVHVTIRLPNGRSSEAVTDPRGLFRFCGVPPGRVWLRAELGDRRSEEVEAEVREQDFSRADLRLGGGS